MSISKVYHSLKRKTEATELENLSTWRVCNEATQNMVHSNTTSQKIPHYTK